MNFKNLFTVFLLFLVQFGFAQSFKYRTYTYKDGLPQDYVYCLNQGKWGNLWVGTGEGLARFDGKTFDKFGAEEGWKNDFVTASFVDKNQNIWLGHFNGAITFYNNNVFNELKINQISQSPVNTFFQDNTGAVWAGTKINGLIRIHQDLKVEVYNDLFNFGINSIVQDKRNILWIATDEGLYKMEYSNGKLSLLDKKFEDKKIQTLYYNKSIDRLAAGTEESGILWLQPANNDLKVASSSFEGHNINCITTDKFNNLIVSSFGEGVYKCQFTSTNDLEVVNHYNEKSGLVSNYVKSLFVDRENNTWFGTYGNGLAILLDPDFTLFSQADGLAENSIGGLTIDKFSNLWVASGKKINLLENNASVFKPLAGVVTPSPITSVVYYESIIIIGTEEDGVYTYNPASKKLSPWKFSKYENLLNRVNQVITDKDKSIWVATDGGLYKYDGKTQQVNIYTMLDGLPHNNVRGLFSDKNSRIWLATHGGGLGVYFNGGITSYKTPIDNRSLDINCITEDKKGKLWIGTNGQGLFVFEKGKFTKRYTLKNSIGSLYSYFLKFDQKGNLWIGHKNGISKFNTRTEKATFFETNKDNILSEVTPNSVVSDSTGNIWFGTINGIVKCNPEAQNTSLSVPIINLTSVLLNFKDVDWTKYTDSVYKFGKIPHNLVLPYNQNHLTFNVKSISLKPGAENMYFQYKLEGFEDSWSLVTKEPFVTYSNIPPGTYTFKVRAKSENGNWTESKERFSFTINSPFWKTWWFIIFSIFVGIGLVTGIVKDRTSRLKAQRERLKKDKMVLEEEIQERIKAQKQQKLVEKKLKETNQELNNFIYRSSHDLRGPISTVKGLTQLGAIEIQEPKAQKFFSMILDRTQALDSVLKNLINVVEVTEEEIRLSTIDFSKLISKVSNYFSENNHSVDIQIKLDTISTEYQNDVGLIESIFKNIIDNSIKYRKQEIDNPYVIVTIQQNKLGLELHFEDNGIGIEQDIIPKIFDMFYRGSDESKGSGLGLYTVKKIIEKLQGSIQISSEVNKGTTVHIILPNLVKLDEGKIEVNKEELA